MLASVASVKWNAAIVARSSRPALRAPRSGDMHTSENRRPCMLGAGLFDLATLNAAIVLDE